MSVHVGIDVGGTFTDFVILWSESGRLDLLKVPSTRPATGSVLHGLHLVMQRYGIKSDEIRRLVHGSTVATNAILEARWAKTALLTTAGFGDVLEIGRQNRAALYDLSVERPEPLVPRRLRFGIEERLDYRGQVLKKLETEPVRALARSLEKEAIESIAISFLFAYVNPAHERATRSILEEYLDLPITLSSEILPEYREYERTATTVMSAALQPVVGRYLEELDGHVRESGICAPLQVMQSNGGIVLATRAAKQAVQMLFSGPAGGVEGARFLGRQAGFENLITFDMGGTSTDVSLVQDSKITMKTEGTIEGRPVRIPMVDIHSIGAGGGSLAWIDAGKALRVGPQSAGSDPGPAAYGQGSEPTVTDAQLVLGRLSETNLFSERTLKREAAERAIFDVIAKPLRLSLEEAAIGILEIADAQMERAIRLITVERGRDPRGFALLAFGGAGPMHASGLAQRLSIPKVIVPPVAGVLSALGLLVADSAHDLVQTFVQRADNAHSSQMEAYFELMQDKAQERLRGEPIESISFIRALDLRYRGQSYDLSVEITEERLTQPIINQAVLQFHQEHKQLYGYAMDRPVEIVNLRLRALGRMTKPSIRLQTQEKETQPALPRRRKIYLRSHGWVESTVLAREVLVSGRNVQGPAIIEGRESTIVILPRQRASVDSYGNVIIESEGTE
jgi:N-methylhydantoinase A